MSGAGFGVWFRGVREGRGWTQETLAARVAVTSVTVSNWERGSTLPTTQHILPLARALKIDPAEILQRLTGERIENGTKSPAHVAGVLETVQTIRKALDDVQQAALEEAGKRGKGEVPNVQLGGQSAPRGRPRGRRSKGEG